MRRMVDFLLRLLCLVGVHHWHLVGTYTDCGGALRAVDHCGRCGGERDWRFLRNPWERATWEEMDAGVPIREGSTIGVDFDGNRHVETYRFYRADESEDIRDDKEG